MLHKIFLCTLVLQALWLIACGESSKGAGSKTSGTALVQQVESDRAQIGVMPFPGAQIADANNNGAFTKLFGGPSGQHLQQYLSERVHFIFDAQELADAPVVALKGGHAQNGLVKQVMRNSFGEDFAVTSDTLAYNFGGHLWVNARASRLQNLTVQIRGQNIRVGDPRVGLVGVTPLYFKQVESAPSTLSLRLTTLFHEARHSDCSGGAPASGSVTQNPTCLYFHAICKPPHKLQGKPGCDTVPWGAYTVSLVYLTAALNNPGLSAVEERALKIKHKDMLTRLSDEAKAAIFNTTPDLSSSAD